MLPDRVSNPGPLTYESGALPIALRGPASVIKRLNTNHYEKRSNLHVWCSKVAWCAYIESCTLYKRKGTGFRNGISLHKILLCFAKFPFSNVT